MPDFRGGDLLVVWAKFNGPAPRSSESIGRGRTHRPASASSRRRICRRASAHSGAGSEGARPPSSGVMTRPVEPFSSAPKFPCGARVEGKTSGRDPRGPFEAALRHAVAGRRSGLAGRDGCAREGYGGGGTASSSLGGSPDFSNLEPPHTARDPTRGRCCGNLLLQGGPGPLLDANRNRSFKQPCG